MNKNIKIENLEKNIPIFPLSDCLLLPSGTVTLNIFEPRYLSMTEDAIASNRLIGMIQPIKNKIHKTKLYDIGCLGKITHFSELKDQKYLIELTGLCRYRIIEHSLTDKGYFKANTDYTEYYSDLNYNNKEIPSKLRKEFIVSLKDYFKSQHIKADWKIIEKAPSNLLIISLAQSCPFNPEEKQILLESKDLNDLTDIMVTLFKITSAGEIKNIN